MIFLLVFGFFQAFQMSPNCNANFHCPTTEDPIFGFAEDSTTTTIPSGLSVVSPDNYYQQESDKTIAKSPTVSFLSFHISLMFVVCLSEKI